MLEVLAYALDEAAEGATTRVDVLARRDGSIEVSDDGRGTDTRADDSGTMIVKPVMATADLRFHDRDDAPVLPDGLPRRGMSVVSALCSWVEHTNARAEGAWIARYEHGVPTAPPQPVRDVARGTSVRLSPDPEVFGSQRLDLVRLRHLVDAIGSTASIRCLEV